MSTAKVLHPENGGHGPAHTLSELLRDDQRPIEDRLKDAAKSKLPVVVIAVFAHLIVAAVLTMAVVKSDRKNDTASSFGAGFRAQNADEPLIEEKSIPATDAALLPTALAEIPDYAPGVDDFTTVDVGVDEVISPYASGGTPGIAEGIDDAKVDTWSASVGGHGLATAIGIGSGGHAGGGARKGTGDVGTRGRLRRIANAPPLVAPGVQLDALNWIARHQSPDGSWDPVGFDSLCTDGKCTGRGSSVHTAGLTGLALLTFLGAGYDSTRPSAYVEVVRRGLKWLKNNQDAEGCFGSRANNRFTYSHACATLAMCEAYASHRSALWKTGAQAGLKFISQCQNPYKAWRYGVKPGDNDSSVTGWMLMALKAGKDAGLEVDTAAMRDGLSFLDQMTDEETGRTGYVKRGDAPVRPEGLVDKFPAAESESLTAVAMCARIFCGTANEKRSLMRAGADLCAKRLPVWDEASGKIDMYYWYYGTLAMFQMGGNDWDTWMKALKPLIVDHQVKTGCERGSWDPKDPWSEDGGRIYSTCLMTLCLEIYYRYPRVFGTK